MLERVWSAYKHCQREREWLDNERWKKKEKIEG